MQRNGRTYWRSTRETNKGRAQARVAGMLAEIQDQAYGAATPTASPWVLDWWDGYWATRTGSSAQVARSVRPHVAATFGSFRLRDLRPSHAERYIHTRLAAGRATTTVANEGTLLKIVLRAAVREGLLERDPFASVAWPKRAIRTEVLSREDEAALLAALEEPQQRRYGLFLQLALATGLRGGELVALRAEQVRERQGAFVLDVTGKGGKRRQVPVFPAGRAALLELMDGKATGYLWTGTRKRRSAVSTVNAMWARAWHRAELAGKPVTTHVCRHTFATRYLQAGGDMLALSKVLGHSASNITERVYVHLSQDDILDQALSVQMS